eukprot:UN07656
MGCNNDREKPTTGNADDPLVPANEKSEQPSQDQHDEVYKWLNRIKFPKYYRIFKAEGITMDKLIRNCVTVDTLQNMSINEPDRKQIMQNINALLPNPNDEDDSCDISYPNDEDGIKLFINEIQNLGNKEFVINQFMENKINDCMTLCQLTDAILRDEIGIKAWGDRNKIIRAIK